MTDPSGYRLKLGWVIVRTSELGRLGELGVCNPSYG